jgi:hypothetical protein
MSTLPSGSNIVSTTFSKDLINVYSVSEVYTATVAYTGTGGTYTGTVPLSPGYNTTTYKVLPSIACSLQNTTSGQYVYDVIITSRTEIAFIYSIYVATGFGSAQTITLDFLVTYNLT